MNKNKHYIPDLLNSIKEYAEKYNCTLIESIKDLDHPVSCQDLKDLNIGLTDLEIDQLGYSDDKIREYWNKENAEYNSIYGED